MSDIVENPEWFSHDAAHIYFEPLRDLTSENARAPSQVPSEQRRMVNVGTDWVDEQVLSKSFHIQRGINECMLRPCIRVRIVQADMSRVMRKLAFLHMQKQKRRSAVR